MELCENEHTRQTRRKEKGNGRLGIEERNVMRKSEQTRQDKTRHMTAARTRRGCVYFFSSN